MNNINIVSGIDTLGYREFEQVIELLNAYREGGVPDTFYDNGVSIQHNVYSDCVYIINSDYQILAMNGGDLEMFFYTPYSGHEGFADDLLDEFEADYDDWHADDIEYMIDNGAWTEDDVRKALGYDEDDDFDLSEISSYGFTRKEV